MHGLGSVVQESVSGPPLWALHMQEVEIELANLSNAIRLGQYEPIRTIGIRENAIRRILRDDK